MKAGFDKGDFQFLDYGGDDNTDVTALVYRPRPEYLFVFYPGDRWSVAYAPGESTRWSDNAPGHWENVLQRVEWWLKNLRREVDVTDPWAAYAESVEPFSLGFDPTDNTPFSPDERSSLSAQLAEVKTLLLDGATDAEVDRHAIIESIDRLEEATGRLGRIDWRGLAIGTLFELLLIGYATPEGVRGAVNLLVGAAQRLLQ